MSAACDIGLTIGSLAMLQQALDEIQFSYRVLEELRKGEERLFTLETADGRVEKVNVLVTDPEGIKIGFQRQKNGQYKIITSAVTPAHLQKQKDVVNRIRQRYAYNLVKQELRTRGYAVVEEKDVGNKTIRIVARRWR